MKSHYHAKQEYVSTFPSAQDMNLTVGYLYSSENLHQHCVLHIGPNHHTPLCKNIRKGTQTKI